MLCALLRNPLLRLLFQLWWLPVLASPILLVLIGAWAPWPLPHPGWVTIAYGAALAGMVGVACLHAGDAAVRERLRHELAGHRFLCPHCLHFGEIRFGCAACGREVEACHVHTRGAYVNDCAHCGAVLFSREGESGQGVAAWCRRCKRTCEREVHHERQVRVVGALRENDFVAACAAVGVQPVQSRSGIRVGCHDDGACFTLLFCLGDLPSFAGMLPHTHAFWSVEQIWLDGNDVEPLRLGETVDRFLHRTGLLAARRRTVAIGIGGDAPDATRRLLAARFGPVVCHVAPTEWVAPGAPGVLSPRERAVAIGKGG
jgi:hypothetical protein